MSAFLRSWREEDPVKEIVHKIDSLPRFTHIVDIKNILEMILATDPRVWRKLCDRFADKLASLDQLNVLSDDTLLFSALLSGSRRRLLDIQFATALLRKGADVPLDLPVRSAVGTHPIPLLAVLTEMRLLADPAEKEDITELFEEVLRCVTFAGNLHRYIHVSASIGGHVTTLLDEVLRIPEWAHIADALRSQGAVTGDEYMRTQVRQEAQRVRQEAEEARQTKRTRTDFSSEIDSDSKRIELLFALRRTKAAGGKRTVLKEGDASRSFTAIHMTSMAPGAPSDDIFIIYGLPPTEDHTVVAEIRVKKGITADTTIADLEIALKGPGIGAGHGRRKTRIHRSNRTHRTSRRSHRNQKS